MQSLKEQEHSKFRLQALFKCSADAIFITDFDSAEFVEFNSHACRLFDYTPDELRGKTGRQLHPAEDGYVVDEISQELREKGSVTREAVRFCRRDGSTLWGALRSSVYEVDGRRLYVAIVKDISGKVSDEQKLREAYGRLRDTQSQLLHSSRLAAVGQLAAGIAHEINNPAACILVNLQVLKQDLSELRAGAEGNAAAQLHPDSLLCLEDSMEAVRRIATVVKGLSGFARIDHDSVQVVQINEVVRYANRLVSPQVRHCARIEHKLEANTDLLADHGKLSQVIVNLLLNAAQAIEEHGGSRILVSTRSIPNGILISVEDDGPGVAKTIRARIFEPFFTTKTAERGTGLGLSLCADIVQQHSGKISVRESALGGALFELFIPLDTHLRANKPSNPPISGAEFRGRVLVIDDEVALARAYQRTLSTSHEVVLAYSGEQALNLLAKDERFDIILCDLMMPGIDGVSVYEHLEAAKPHLLKKLVFCTGGATTTRCQHFIGRSDVTVLEKPVGVTSLSQLLLKRVKQD